MQQKCPRRLCNRMFKHCDCSWHPDTHSYEGYTWYRGGMASATQRARWFWKVLHDRITVGAGTTQHYIVLLKTINMLLFETMLNNILLNFMKNTYPMLVRQVVKKHPTISTKKNYNCNVIKSYRKLQKDLDVTQPMLSFFSCTQESLLSDFCILKLPAFRCCKFPKDDSWMNLQKKRARVVLLINLCFNVLDSTLFYHLFVHFQVQPTGT